ncbi:ABC transporter ATP-binding protein [Kamptonema cortianum]|uniref:ABC transporter ATP-binding protein n=1 Tax=Geitlerinema calcuttense NRMC-F 0142 TaxID=2922238 RepID=A0ABT7M498_9CYAN|nr:MULTISPECIES: ABC transporter ATP-binding protein [Cyanophyceae]MDK3161832.1 ABC transporter ATP-binding protein [Kamptonema cortianum]MDL5054403.1 ABC transporter ATP-binding protein [Oscillatoria laete-virens NRMC-F 0139]MDL5057871.1 ABC transporter ATP-binding protein [Geitlerinema calcuttense NRMC-F 0142]
MPEAIEIRQLTKKFQLGWRRGTMTAVDALDMTVREGEVFGLLGPNGSGKSTTLKILLGLVSPTSGSASIFGESCHRVETHRLIGYLPENPYFYNYLTGEETLRFFGELTGLSGKLLRQRSGELLDLVGLADGRQKRRLRGYSKGMLQRIGLAQALIHDPEILFLDEPTAGVDPVGSREIRDLILELKKRGKTILLCSHLLEQVQEVCDHICVLHCGKKILDGRMEELAPVQNRYSVTMENITPENLAKIEAEIARLGGRVLETGHPTTTLEKLFLEAVEKAGPTHES